jgi:ubiquinone/menaquinone biosynthesis C-methylase UbiE
MQRISAPELLDSDACSPREVELAMQDLDRVNRWFGGVRTSQASIERVAQVTGSRRFSLLEIAAGSGEVPRIATRNLAHRGITVEVTLLDRAQSHLPRGKRALVGDALALPFPDQSFDLISCSLFAHHLEPRPLAAFVREALRVSRRALLINDLVRHPAHLALAYAGFPLMRSRVAWLDGLTSVRRAYVPEEIREIVASAFPPTATPRVEITRHYLFRMGVIVWKGTKTL